MKAPKTVLRGSLAWLGALPLLAAIWACSSESGVRTPGSGSGTQGSNGSTDSGSGGGSSTNGSGTSGTTDGSGTNGSSTTTAGTTTGGDGPVNFNLDCASPAVGAPVLRLLTRQELTNTLNAVFPELTGQWQSTLDRKSVV